MRALQVLSLATAVMLLPLESAVGAEDMKDYQAWNTMFAAASGFASSKSSAWNSNTYFYLLWRQGKVAITADCFWGGQGTCLFTDRTDKELVTRLFDEIKDGEAKDSGLQKYLQEDRSLRPYAAYFQSVILAPNIEHSYYNAKNALLKEGSTASPKQIVAFLAAVARKVREDSKQALDGWSSTDLLGWVVLYHPSWGEKMANYASKVADIPIPHQEIQAH